MKKDITKNPYQTYGYTVKAPNKTASGVKPTCDEAGKATRGGKKA